MFKASHSGHDVKNEAEVDNIVILKKLKLFFMSNKYKGLESQDCDLYNSVLEIHKAILVYVEDEKIHKLFVNDEPLEPQDSIKIIGKMIESVQLSNRQASRTPTASSTTTPTNIDIKANAERDVIAIAGPVIATASGIVRIGGTDVINHYASKSVLDEATLALKEKQALAQLKTSYLEPEHATIPATFGSPLKLEGQYINLQILCVDLENKKIEEDKEFKGSREEKSKHEENKLKQEKRYKDERMVSVEDLFGDKHTIKTEDLFKPIQELFDEQELQAIGQEEDKPPRLLLIQGRAGIGKTTFVHYVGHEWSKGQLYSHYTWVFTLTLRKLRVLPNTQELSLIEWIRQSQFNNWPPKEFEMLWLQRIEPAINQNKVLLILDGYDEVPDRHPCQAILNSLLQKRDVYQNLLLLITTRPSRAENITDERRNLEVIGFTDENINHYIQTYFLKIPNRTLVSTLTEALRKQPIIWANAHIPLNLNLLCGIMEEAIKKAHAEGLNQGLAQLSSMTRLYQVMEKKLYERSHSRHDTGPIKIARQLIRAKIDFIKHYQKERLFLAKLAFQSFAAECIIIPLQIVGDALKAYVDKEVTQISQRSILQEKENLAEVFFDDICRLGLIKPVLDKSDLPQTEQDYEFLHLTFQEYYTAIYLAEGLSDKESEVRIEVEKVILKEKYNPRWQIVWWFVAGLLRENTPVYESYLSQLQGKCRGEMLTEDILQHYQLGLLARCVDEGLEPNNDQVIEPIIKQLQKSFLRLYQITKNLSSEKELRQNLKHLGLSKSPFFSACRMSPNLCMSKTQDLYALIPEASESQDKYFFVTWIASVQIATPKTSHILSRLLIDRDENLCRSAISAFGKLGIFAATPQIFYELVKLCASSDKSIRRAARWEVSQFEIIAQTPEFVVPLISLLTDKNSEVRYYVTSALVKLVTAATLPQILDRLVKLLTNKSNKVRGYATEAAVSLRTVVATPLFMDALTKLLEDKDGDIRDSAAKTVAKLGAVVATPQILMALMKLLEDREGNVRRSAVLAVGGLGAAATPEIVDALGMLMLSLKQDSGMRSFIAETVAKLGTIAATPQMMDALTQLLGDRKCNVRRSAVLAVGNLGAAITPRVIDALGMLMLSLERDIGMRSFVAETVAKLGTVAATPKILTALKKLLEDRETKVRLSAVLAVGNLGTAVTPEILDALGKLLLDSNSGVCSSAAEAICKLDVVATPRILDVLPKLLENWDSGIRNSALSMLNKFGVAATTPQILKALLRLLGDVRYPVSEMIDKVTTVALPQVLDAFAELLTNSNSSIRYSRETRWSQNYPVKPEFLEVLKKLLINTEKYVSGCSSESTVVMSQISKSLGRFLADEDSNVRSLAAETVDKLSIAVKPKIIEALLRLLADRNSDVRQYAIEALSTLGVTITTPQVQTLIGLLENGKSWVRRSVARAVGKLSIAPIEPPVLEVLEKLLADTESEVRSSAAEAVAKLGTPVATPKILKALTKLLVNKKEEYEEYRVCCSAAKAVGNLGAAAATSEILYTLAQLSGAKKNNVCYAAREAIDKLVVVAEPKILKEAIHLLADENRGISQYALKALVKVGVTAVTPQVLGALAKLLADTESDVRCSVIQAIDKFEVAAEPKILDVLVQLLADKECSVRYAARHTVDKLGIAVEPKILDRMMRLLGDENANVRQYAIEALSKLGASIATSEVIETLAKLLGNKESGVRESAARAVVELGTAAITPIIIEALAKLLIDTEYDVRYHAMQMVDKLGIAAEPKILDILMRLLADNEGSVCHSAERMLDKLGAVAEPKIFERVVRLLEDENKRVRQCVARYATTETTSMSIFGVISMAVTPSMSQVLYILNKMLTNKDRSLGSFVLNKISNLVAMNKLTPEILGLLLRLLSDKESNMRSSAVQVIGDLNVTSITPQILHALGLLLEDENQDVRRHAAEAVGKLGNVAATSEILRALGSLLTDEDKDVCRYAAEAVGKLGAVAATPQILHVLGSLLTDENKDVRRYTAEAIGKLGAIATTPKILGALARLLADKSRDTHFYSRSWERSVCCYAAEAVGHLGAVAGTPEILCALTELSLDTEDSVRRYATDAMIKLLDAADATPKFLEELLKLLAHKNRDVRDFVVKRVIKLGTAVVTPRFLDALAIWLKDTDSDVCHSTLKVVESLGAVAAIPKILDALAGLLADTGWRSSSAMAMEVVGKLGIAAATFQIFDALIQLLGDRGRNASSSVLEVLHKLITAASATPQAFAVLSKLLTHRNREARRFARELVDKLDVAAIPQFLGVLVMLLANTDRKVYWDAAQVIRQLNKVAMPKLLDALLGIFSVPGENNALLVFEICIDSIFTFFPSFWAENANHPNILDFLAHILAGAYLNSQISCQIYFDKNVQPGNYCIQGFIEKSSYCFSIASTQTQYLYSLAPFVIKQVSKTGKIDVKELRVYLSKSGLVAENLLLQSSNFSSLKEDIQKVIVQFPEKSRNSKMDEQKIPTMLTQYRQVGSFKIKGDRINQNQQTAENGM